MFSQDLNTPISLSYLDTSSNTTKIQVFCFQNFKDQPPPSNTLAIPDICKMKRPVSQKISWKKRQKQHYPHHFPKPLAIHSSATANWLHSVNWTTVWHQILKVHNLLWVVIFLKLCGSKSTVPINSIERENFAVLNFHHSWPIHENIENCVIHFLCSVWYKHWACGLFNVYFQVMSSFQYHCLCCVDIQKAVMLVWWQIASKKTVKTLNSWIQLRFCIDLLVSGRGLRIFTYIY